MQQYSKAIKALLGSNGGREKAADVALVTCVLFVYFETLRGHHATAISHINGGIKILSAFHQSASSSCSSHSTISQSGTPYVSTLTLTLIFVHLDTQASPSSLAVNVLSKTPPPTTPYQATHPKSRKNFKVWKKP
jgi:hypothetical protein